MDAFDRQAEQLVADAQHHHDVLGGRALDQAQRLVQADQRARTALDHHGRDVADARAGVARQQAGDVLVAQRDLDAVGLDDADVGGLGEHGNLLNGRL
jgi:hypothetical protein